MTVSKHSLPLSRWHHVADRIREHGERKQAQALNTLAQAQVNSAILLDADQVAALEERGQKALESLKEARMALQTVGHIRATLAEVNAQENITMLLAKADAKRRELKLLQGISSIDLLTRIPVGRIEAVLRDQQSSTKDSTGLVRPSMLPVALVSPGALAYAEQEASDLEAEIAALTDQVADRNRKVIALELPVALAKVAGL